jgi:hypothetical protein
VTKVQLFLCDGYHCVYRWRGATRFLEIWIDNVQMTPPNGQEGLGFQAVWLFILWMISWQELMLRKSVNLNFIQRLCDDKRVALITTSRTRFSMKLLHFDIKLHWQLVTFPTTLKVCFLARDSDCLITKCSSDPIMRRVIPSALCSVGSAFPLPTPRRVIDYCLL